jgi:hypothetical protein
VDTLVVFALSNLATMFMTAWLLHRRDAGLSPLPTRTPKAEVNHEEAEPTYKKGRPIL